MVPQLTPGPRCNVGSSFAEMPACTSASSGRARAWKSSALCTCARAHRHSSDWLVHERSGVTDRSMYRLACKWAYGWYAGVPGHLLEMIDDKAHADILEGRR